MTEEQAAALLKHIEDLSEKLSLADDQAAKDRAQAKRTRNLTRWLLAATGVLVVVSVVLVGVVHQNKQNAIAACESGNARNEGMRAWMANYFAVSNAGAVAQGQDDGPIGDYYRALEAWTYSDTLPYRDCDDLSKQIPKPGDPPSFEEALKAALEDEADG